MNNPLICAAMSRIRNPAAHEVRISTQPTNAVAGDTTASFSVSSLSTNGQPLAYQWQRSTDGGGSWTNLSGATSSTLSLTSLTSASNGYQYRVVITAQGASPVTSRPATLFMKSPGYLYYCGNNSQSLSGDLTTTARLAPTKVGTSGSWTSAAATNGSAFAINSSGELYAWGFNGYGNLGLGVAEFNLVARAPTRVGSASNWSGVSAGYFYAHGVTSANKLFGWGYNQLGYVGDGTTTQRLSPVEIGAANSGYWASVSNFNVHSAALTTFGDIYQWGDNTFGQLGDGTYTNRTSPVIVSTQLGGWKQVSVGYNHTVALSIENELYAWGHNDYGQLGTGQYGQGTNKTTPFKIADGLKFAHVSAGGLMTLAVSTDGHVYSCGLNNYGRLGYGYAGPASGAEYASPTLKRIAQLENVISVTAGTAHAAAVTADGSMYTWGSGVSASGPGGQLGDGTQTTRAAPQQVAASVPWILASCGVVESLWVGRA